MSPIVNKTIYIHIKIYMEKEFIKFVKKDISN